MHSVGANKETRYQMMTIGDGPQEKGTTVNVRKKVGALIVLGAVIVSLVAYHLFGWQVIGIYMMERGARQAHQQRVRLLSKTDHQALLNAGREILQQLPQGYLTSQDGRYSADDLPIPESVGIPQAIRDLGAGRIRVRDNGSLAIDMHGGMDHFGFFVYPEGFEQSHPKYQHGNRKIIDGLWYYDDGYDYDSDYDKVVDRLLMNGGE